MPLLVGVNSYVTADEADDYLSDRLYSTAWTDATTAQRESALVMASRALDGQHYRGAITSDSQAMAWPRDCVYDQEGRAIDSAVVPQAVKDAQCEVALALLAEDPAEARDPNTARVKAGSVEMSFYRSHTSQTALRGSALALVKPFLLDPGSASARLIP